MRGYITGSTSTSMVCLFDDIKTMAQLHIKLNTDMVSIVDQLQQGCAELLRPYSPRGFN